MIANILGADAGIVLLIALVVLVGGSRLPKLARSVGLAGKEFRNAHNELTADTAVTPAVAAPAPLANVPAAAVAVAASAPTAAVASAALPDAGDHITLSRADLEALLDRREAQATRDANA
jgi:Sec-independent protein translocase protein TatA